MNILQTLLSKLVRSNGKKDSVKNRAGQLSVGDKIENSFNNLWFSETCSGGTVYGCGDLVVESIKSNRNGYRLLKMYSERMGSVYTKVHRRFKVKVIS